jgi:hypothetical protein
MTTQQLIDGIKALNGDMQKKHEAEMMLIDTLGQNVVQLNGEALLRLRQVSANYEEGRKDLIEEVRYLGGQMLGLGAPEPASAPLNGHAQERVS